ncbi:glutathione S-transferase C-terminal domain-containing protein [Hoeflea prorocentri]|uniref:Glutathione S-transferase C-terminal domain-containing protein n=2 Tax=Hoeflea prorocentri TaxID=1922333 RepID=A0A9X3ZJR4_9HYPH|nr:glutathione binding-like protein [Hoeflea prorocentri]MCY6383368.1 glutathione S-transferase C-terminal domain-containing protein [Hoeflea prorocentri]MDA5401168.1 glutathione S-transferase C-terminal domain-containing protein [Hoeflea prorocentri]
MLPRDIPVDKINSRFRPHCLAPVAVRLAAAGVRDQRLGIEFFFGIGEPDMAEIEEATGYFLQFAAVLDNHLKDRDQIAGDGLTIADFGVATFMPLADQAELPLDDFAEIRRWSDKMMELDAWCDPWPESYSTLS